nr:hypothetical protein OG461_05840 [Streptomyces sp. NBC_00995]
MLDTCLTADSVVSDREWLREISRLSKEGVALLTSLGSSPFAFAANSRAPSVFTQHLVTLLGEVAHQQETLDLRDVHKWLRRASERQGYRGPILRNARSFTRPLVPASDERVRRAGGRLLPALRSASAVALTSCARYALSVAGAPLGGFGPLGNNFYDPAGDATTLIDALVDTRCGFTQDTVSLLSTPPSRQRLLDAITEVATSAENMALLYLTAHGSVRQSGRGLDLALHLLDGETVLASDLVAGLRQSNAESVVMFLDVCQVRPAHPVTPLIGHVLPDHQRAGFSRLLIEWTNTATRSLDAASDSKLQPAEQGHSLWRRYADRHSAVAQQEVRWKFDFADARITLVDEGGPLEQWGWAQQLLSSPTSNDALAHADELLSFVADSVSGSGERASQQSALTSGISRAVPTAPADPDPESTEDKGQPRRTHRRHRPRLRVTEGSLPLRVGRRLDFTFSYQPQDPDRQPHANDATDDDPLDLTLRIGAGTAEVSPTIIHTRLTDDRGTPPEQFRITPSSADPVRLRIDVLRRTDGAVIQRIERVLVVAGRDGSTN